MTTHVEDGTLLRFLDGECHPGEHQAVALHRDACGRCATRLAQLSRRAQLTRQAIGLWDADMRPALRVSFPWRRAAVVMVMLGIGGAVRPVRAWIADGARAVWMAVAGTTTDGDIVPPPDQPAVASGLIRFEPAGTTFELTLPERQRAGVLRIEIAARPDAEAEVVGGSGAEDLMVLPTGLRIVSRAQSEASYTVRLPLQVEVVRVVFRDQPALTLLAAGSTTRWEVDLAQPPESTTVKADRVR
ncbi:MAG TPA: hypothetical protein VGA37_13410 [Gemmatimonadales bacterium]